MYQAHFLLHQKNWLPPLAFPLERNVEKLQAAAAQRSAQAAQMGPMVAKLG